MANPGSESEEEEWDASGDTGGWAPAQHTCCHVREGIGLPLNALPDLSGDQGPECSVDGCECKECWLCLKCRQVLCGRYGNKHMVGHFKEHPEHCVALGIGDLSFWCYQCDSYLHHLVIREVFEAYKASHLAKFGYEIPRNLDQQVNFAEQDEFMKYMDSGETDEERERVVSTAADAAAADADGEEKDADPDPNRRRRNPKNNPLYGRRGGGGTTGASTALNKEEVREFFDEPEVMRKNARLVARCLQTAKHCVVYTGAGISTAAKIPDYRGPKGVWTMRAQGKTAKFGVPLEQAVPTFSHMALAKMVDKGMVKHVVSTNVDGLHRRSGIGHENLSELHGNIYLEYCNKCGAEYLRTFSTTNLRRQRHRPSTRLTGRLCQESGCNGKLRDSIIAFGENLPENELTKSLQESAKADLVIVIGSSMRVSPACNLPSLSYNKRGTFVLVNLQKTPYDKHSHIRAFSKCDEFFRAVCDELRMEVPRFKEDRILEEVHKDMERIRLDPDF